MEVSSTEQELTQKGLNAPRITPADITYTVVDEKFHVLADILTVCVLTLRNGFTVTGESACASPANFDKEIGERIAKETAMDKVWLLEGYLLKQRLYEDSL